MNIDYKFNLDEKVKYKPTGEKGIILDRAYPFDTFAISLLPGKYYLIETMEKYPQNKDGVEIDAPIRLSCKENSLERVSKKKFLED